MVGICGVNSCTTAAVCIICDAQTIILRFTENRCYSSSRRAKQYNRTTIGLELTKLTNTRRENNPIRHRGDPILFPPPKR